MKKLTFTFISLLLLLTSCSNNEEIIENDKETMALNSSTPNVLLIIADDMGIDATPGFELGDEKPNMPTISNLQQNGITYTNTWSNPVCSPTRAGILTGKYGFNTNVLNAGDQLNTNEISIQNTVKQSSTYKTAVIGKWHLSDDPNHPNDMGIDYYAGSLPGGLRAYNDWTLTVNGLNTPESSYATTKYTDLAIDWIKTQDQPWFLWLAHNTPHTPFHLPPNDLHNRNNLPNDQASINSNPRPYYFAMIEAMDKEIGRLLESFDKETLENTLIIFVGDNGTPSTVSQAYNSRRTKGSIFQGGIHVPLIVSGGAVTKKNTTDDSLINTVDLFATIAEATGSSIFETNESISFKTTFSEKNANSRSYNYSEIGTNNETVTKAIRSKTHKYILFGDNTEALYNLENDPLENINLLNENRLPLNNNDKQQLDDLKTALSDI